MTLSICMFHIYVINFLKNIAIEEIKKKVDSNS